jgi:fatty-acyl-CoA synthase
VPGRCLRARAARSISRRFPRQKHWTTGGMPVAVSLIMQASFVCGVSNEPLRYQTVGQALDEAAERWGEREALVVCHQGIRWTYAELKQRCDALAAGFVARGLQRGDRVGIWAPNCAEWVLAQFATAKAGLILVTINPAYRTTELEYALNKTGCKALVLASRWKSSDFVAMLSELAPELESCAPGALRAQRLPQLSLVVQIGEKRVPASVQFPELCADGQAEHARRVDELSDLLQADDAINIQFTSGTTGLPKGATLSHFNIVNNGLFTGQAMRLRDSDRMCIPVPLYHCFGMVLGNLACVTHGATMVYPSESFDAGATLRAVAQERCSVLYGVPTMFIAELEHPELGSLDLTCLRTGMMAGAPCPIEVMKRLISTMHMKEVTIGYGMTETSPISFQSAIDDPLERRVSSVGRVHPHVQVKVIGPDGRVVPRGEQGELCTRGYSVMKGYWEDPERTREAIDQDGFMRTGDLGTIDAEGYCNITGRLKDMLIRGGENVFPREIEDYLYRHPKIKAVQVFGVPDAKYGEEVCAWVQLRDGEACSQQEVVEFCRGRIAHYKIPRYVRFVTDFPMTVSGKPQKFLMREQMMRELGLHAQSTA